MSLRQISKSLASRAAPKSGKTPPVDLLIMIRPSPRHAQLLNSQYFFLSFLEIRKIITCLFLK
jgi:hypothetical protein